VTPTANLSDCDIMLLSGRGLVVIDGAVSSVRNCNVHTCAAIDCHLMFENYTESGESNSLFVKTASSRFSDSGSVSIQTGSSAGGNGGDITLQTGPSTEGAPGSIQLVTGGLGRGGDISLRAGQGSDSTGGSIHFQSGSSESSSSGGIVIESPHVSSPSSLGPSGNIALSTGDANKSSGSCKDSAAFSRSNDVSDPCLHQPSCFIPITPFTVTISTGSSLQEKSGDINIESGKSPAGQGGKIALQSGRSDEVGGSALISAGDGVGGGGPLMLNGGSDLSSDEENAKAGGSVFIKGGLSIIGDGGAVSVAGGFSEQGVGGKLRDPCHCRWKH
jgi:hypothetical protein